MAEIVDKVEEMFRKHRRGERIILACLCAVLFGELFFSVRQLSQTADEATHLYAGYRDLKCGDLTVSPEHPPLAKIVAAAPLLLMNLRLNCTPFKGGAEAQALTSLSWLYLQNWRPALARARVAVSVFALGLCLLVWIAARRMFDFATAIVATTLLVFEPSVLAFGGIVMTDLPVTCTMLLAVYGFYLWVNHRTARYLMLTALATGLTLLAKHSGLVVVPILCVLAVVDALVDRAGPKATVQVMGRNLLAVALICAIAIGVVWAGYGMRFAAHPGSVQFPEAAAGATSSSARILDVLKHYRVLPEAYLEGFARALSISSQPGPAFVAGKIYLHAPWFSTPLNLLIRSTTASWLMILVSAFGVATAFKQHRREILFLLIPLGIFLAVCLRASTNVGVRYLLPMFPLLVVAVAAACVKLAQRVKWARYAIPCLLLLHAASSLHAYPNYLSYANEFWGGPANAYRYVTWLDIGQAYPEARAYLDQHPAKNCWFFTGWQWDPRMYGVRCQSFGPYLPNQVPPRVQGTVLLSGTLLTDVRLVEGDLAVPFKNLTPRAKIGGSALLVYEGDFDTRLAAALSERFLVLQALSAKQYPAALMHGQRSVELAPDSVLSHTAFCSLLMQAAQLDKAANECSIAHSLALQDPLREEPLRRMFLTDIETKLAQLNNAIRAANGRDAAIEPSVPSADSK